MPFSIFGGRNSGAAKAAAKISAAPPEALPAAQARPLPAAAVDFSALFGASARTTAPDPVREPPAGSQARSGSRASPEEEAAFLFSNGQIAEARARLEAELNSASGGAERIWLMLLDLYQEIGERKAFDQLALEYVVRFERSAPSWRVPLAAPVDAMLRTGGAAYVSLTGRLSTDSKPDLDRIREVAAKNRLLRIDFSKLKGMDAAGCGMLHSLLQSIRHQGGDAMFSGESALLGALSKAAQPGARGVEAVLWLLRLELLQWQGRQQEFEQVALEYAMTYEISPPSFERLSAPAAPPSAGTAGAAQRKPTGAPPDALAAPGEITGEADAFFRQLDAHAETRSLVLVDLSGLKRMDVVAAGCLLNTVIRLDEAGKRLELLQPSALVTALLDMVGVTELAKVVPRR